MSPQLNYAPLPGTAPDIRVIHLVRTIETNSTTIRTSMLFFILPRQKKPQEQNRKNLSCGAKNS
jgi:hypothetical protein